MKSKSICGEGYFRGDLDKAIDLSHSFDTPHSVWSIFNVVEKMDEIAFKGENLTVEYKLHWGEYPVEVKLPNNPTWRNLMDAADELIGRSGDSHHVFVEDFIDHGNGILELVTGS